MRSIRFGSVCSGIEAASVAWHPLGWRAAWLSEIEPFPSAVLAHHYPDVPNLGDMTKLPERIRSGEIEAPDVFCGGTPCQAFSVAGLRKSLDDVRGNLSLVFCEIANAIDAVRAERGELPAIDFWENVPGVLSTSDNAFGCFLAGLAGEDEPIVPEPCPVAGKSSRYWKWNKASSNHTLSWPVAGCVVGPSRTVAWRVTDAQYFGVPQRRRRVFVVASARKGFDPAAVLFEFDGVRRDSAPSRETGEGAAGGAANCSGVGGVQQDGVGGGGGAGGVITLDHGQGGAEISFDRGPTLTCNHEAPIAAYPAVCVTGQVTHTLKAEGFDASEDGTGRGQTIVAFPANLSGTQCASTENLSPSLGAKNPTAVAFAENSRAEVRLEGCDGQRTGAISTGGGKPGQGVPMVATPMAVRRLVPEECEALQGFPRGYSKIPWRKKPAEDCPDGPRYKALGNSWAVPNVRWIGARIDVHLRALSGSISTPLVREEA